MSIYVWFAIFGVSALCIFRFWPITAPESTSNFFATDHGSKPNFYQSTTEEGLFDVPADQLESAFIAQISGLPRLKVLAEKRSNGFHATYVQRSFIFGFPDIITIQITPRSEAHATINLFSQSRFGYSDFGVNRKRIKSLLAGLRQQF
jgi:uncharacterized protein (DUF1499 family)